MYTGCDYDAETGLTYHWNRWRSEDGSAFISEDPARDGANWYGYAGQNPMVYVDRIGLFAYGANGQQYSTNTTQAGTESSETPSATPQNQSPNITGPTGMPEGVSPNLTPTNSNLYHYAGNNPGGYTDPYGRIDSYSFDYEKYLSIQLYGEVQGIIASTKDSIGRFMNGLRSMFTKAPEIIPIGEATLSFGDFSVNGTLEYKKDQLEFNSSAGKDLSNVKLSKLVNASITLDTEGVGGNIGASIPTAWFVDAKINGGVKFNKNGTVTISMTAGVGKNLKVAEGSAVAGALITLGWDTQNGPFGTVQNKKDNSLNQNIRIYNWTKSYEALDSCMGW